MPFFRTRKWPLLAKVAIFTCPKMALRAPERNFWDHFYKPNIPQKCWNCLLFEAFTTFGSVSSQFLNSVLFWQFLECEIAILGTPPVGGLKIVFFQKFFLILFYTTKLQYKSPGPIWKLKKWQKMAIKSPPYHKALISQHFPAYILKACFAAF